MAAIADEVARFMDITGSEAAYASTLLSEHGGDLDLSLASHFAMQEAAGDGGSGGDGGGGMTSPPPLSGSDPPGGGLALPNVTSGPLGPGPAAAALAAMGAADVDPTAGDAAMAAAMAEADAAAAGAEEEPVRAPIPSVVDRLIDAAPRGGGGGAPAAGVVRRRWVGGDSESPFAVAAPLASPYAADAGMARPQEVQTHPQPDTGMFGMAPEPGGLNALFRPPADVTFVGTFDEAMQFANGVSKWLLVNVQAADVFASHVLNRDVWARPAARNLLDTSYVLWQVDASSTDGARYLNYYPGGSPPVVAVVDPRSGERVCSWSIDGPSGEAALRESSLVAELRDWSTRHVLSSSGDAALAAALAASLENGSAEPPATTDPPLPLPRTEPRVPATATVASATSHTPSATTETAAAATAAAPPPHPSSAEDEAATAAADAAHAAAVAAGTRGAPARLVVRLSRGGRLQRTWGAADSMGDVRLWVSRALAREEPGVGGAWQLACVHPRKVFEDDRMTVGEAGLTPSASLVVRRL
ncbi:hypothetical protein MMPV_003033 [Pyropia vietnamensis]